MDRQVTRADAAREPVGDGRISGGGAWIVSLGVVAGTVAYVVAVLGALRHPFNAGADLNWLFLFVTLAIVATSCTVRFRRAGRLLGVAVVPAIGLALVVVSGHLRAAVIAGWLLALAGAWGRFILRRIGVRSLGDALEGSAVAIPLGLAMLALFALALGLAHVLRPWAILTGLVVLTLPQWRVLVRHTGRLGRSWWAAVRAGGAAVGPEHEALVLAVGVSFLLGLTWALSPEVQFDALNYQLTVPRIYVSHGRPVDLPYFFHSYFAHLVNMLFALGLALDGQAVPKLLTLGSGVVTGLGIYVLGRAAFSPRVGMWAATLFASTPLVIWLGSTAYVDLAVGMFLVGGILALLRWRDSLSPGWIWASGALLGAAIGTKLTAVVAVPAFVVLVASTLGRVVRVSPARALNAVCAHVFGVLLFAAPWYVLIYTFTGNPFFPMLNGVFKSPGWPPTNTDFNLQFGVGTSVRALLGLPFALTFTTDRFGEALVPGAMGLSVAWLPLGALLLASRGRHRRALAAAAALSAAAWGWRFQYARFLTPVLPLVVVVVTATLVHVPSNPWARRLHVALLGVVVLAQFAAAPLLFWNVPERFPVKRALGLETAEAFVTRALPGYPAARYLSRVAVPGERVIGPDFPNLRFYVEPPLLSRETAALHAFNVPGASRALAGSLAAHGYTYILVDTRAPRETVGWAFTRAEFLDCCAVPRFARNGVIVYRLGMRAGRATASNLLRNGTFEALDGQGAVKGWRAYGRPTVGAPDGVAHSGTIAIGGGPHDGLTQTVPVEAGTLYRLSHVSRADQPGQHARLQINWLDARGRLVDSTIEVVPAEGQWATHTMLITAPDGAVTAVVYASVHGDSRVWFDDFELNRVE